MTLEEYNTIVDSGKNPHYVPLTPSEKEFFKRQDSKLYSNLKDLYQVIKEIVTEEIESMRS